MNTLKKLYVLTLVSEWNFLKRLEIEVAFVKELNEKKNGGFTCRFKVFCPKTRDTPLSVNSNEIHNINALISIFAQLLKYLPLAWILEKDQHHGPNSNVRKFTYWDQVVLLLFCHSAGCDSLMEIEDGLISTVRHLHASANLWIALGC